VNVQLSARRHALTPAQRRIVEWGDGPVVVIAGAGTGKTRVIVERVRWLLETKGDLATTAPGERLPPQPAENDASEPFAGPLLPEQILVLTYNVKAAKELSNRIEAAVGPAARARISVSNFHSFCHRVLTESAADAGLPAQPDVLDRLRRQT
jgi:superfamily I DNA/RNA helicase